MTTIIESHNEGQLPGQLRIGGEDVRAQITEDFFLTQTAPAPRETPTPAPCRTLDAPGSFWDGAEIIHTYTRADALSDGSLVDVTETATEAGFVYPVAMTRAAWVDLVQWDADDEQRKGFTGNSESGRLWDVLSMARHYAAGAKGSDRFTGVVLRIPREGRGTLPRKAYFKVICGPGDTPAPVLTIMQTDEG